MHVHVHGANFMAFRTDMETLSAFFLKGRYNIGNLPDCQFNELLLKKHTLWKVNKECTSYPGELFHLKRKG